MTKMAEGTKKLRVINELLPFLNHLTSNWNSLCQKPCQTTNICFYECCLICLRIKDMVMLICLYIQYLLIMCNTMIRSLARLVCKPTIAVLHLHSGQHQVMHSVAQLSLSHLGRAVAPALQSIPFIVLQASEEEICINIQQLFHWLGLEVPPHEFFLGVVLSKCHITVKNYNWQAAEFSTGWIWYVSSNYYNALRLGPLAICQLMTWFT